jgi:hypothetical protein
MSEIRVWTIGGMALIGRNQSIRRKACTIATQPVQRKSHMDCPGSEAYVRAERPATNWPAPWKHALFVGGGGGGGLVLTYDRYKGLVAAAGHWSISN